MKLITLTAWAERHFDPPPKVGTLRRWVREKKIHPMPQKIGRTYMICGDAMYTNNANPLEISTVMGVSSSPISERAASIFHGSETNNGEA